MMSYSQRLGRLQLSAGVGSIHVSHLVASPRTYLCEVLFRRQVEDPILFVNNKSVCKSF